MMRFRDTDRDPDTLRAPRGEDGRYPPPSYTSPPGDPIGRRERRDSYATFLVLGLASPFLLAVPLYPLAWFPVWYAILPAAGFLWSVVGSAQAAPPPPGGPMPWDLGPLLSPQVALTWAFALAVAWFVLSRTFGRRSRWHEDSPAKRGFRAGLRLAALAAFLLAILWANRVLASR